MKILDNSDKHLLPLLPRIVNDKLGKTADNFKFIGGGSFGRVYKAVLSDGKTIAIKAYRVQGSQYEEAQQLKLLSENTSVKMPEVLFTYEDENTAILAMSFVDGQNVLNPMFLLKSKSQKQKFANDVVSGMLEWHSVKGEKFGYLENAVYNSWKEFYIENKVQKDLAGLKNLADDGKFSKKNYDLLCRGLDIFKEIVNEPESPVLIHGDLNIMNIMADPKTMKLTAFIDPCGTMWADREYDLFQFLNMWGNAYGLYDTYKAKYPVSEHCDFKVAFYGALHENSMHLKGGLIVPVWEIQNNLRLKKAMEKYCK